MRLVYNHQMNTRSFFHCTSKPISARRFGQSKYNIYMAIKGDFQTCLGFPVPLHSILENLLLQSELLRGQITKTRPFDETESIDVMMANTWNTRLFPKPVGSTANTSFSLRRLFIAISCSFLRWISLEDFEDKNEMALCRRDALPAIALAMLRMLSNHWGLFWQVSNELTNQQFTYSERKILKKRVISLQALSLLTSYQALTCWPCTIFNRRACLQVND